ncbi:MAG: competence/damage-inducible protein A [Acidobacteria bacterium]|nr:competence/damage-inducible protein A [Acidobacteriota bacterium]
MNAEIIAVGSELLTPQRVDTNSLYLTGELNTLGIEVVYKCVIGDDRTRLAETVRAAVERSGVVILTGGLGPTEDDVTRDAVAEALGRGLTFRQEILDGIHDLFTRMGRRMAANNLRQAYAIDGAEVLDNPRGTAPGLWLRTDHPSAVMLLPGPPKELMPMFRNHCLPRLQQLVPPLVISSRWFRCAGIGESDLDQLIAPVYTRYTNPVTTILAKPGDVEIHLRARCETLEEGERLCDEVAGPILELLGERVYSRNGDPLETAVGKLLLDAGANVAVAESCTGGHLGERITSVAGSSAWFAGGFLTYSEAMKTALLGVEPAVIATHGVVSEAVASAMAAGARDRTGATYALATTGIAGPSGGTEAVPTGTVVIGLASAEGVEARRFRFLGDRERIRGLAAQTALNLLRLRLSCPS